MKLTQTPGPTLGGQKPKEEIIQSWSLGKVDHKHSKLKKIMKRQRNTTQMKEQTRNTEIQIKKEEKKISPELQKPNIEAEVYNSNKKCDW